MTDDVSTRPALELVSRSSGGFSEASRRFLRQLGTAVHNSTVRLLGFLKVSVCAEHKSAHVYVQNTNVPMCMCRTQKCPCVCAEHKSAHVYVQNTKVPMCICRTQKFPCVCAEHKSAHVYVQNTKVPMYMCRTQKCPCVCAEHKSAHVYVQNTKVSMSPTEVMISPDESHTPHIYKLRILNVNFGRKPWRNEEIGE
jgi:hypothetical protein